MNQTNTKSKSQIWGWDWICIQFGNYSHSLKSFRYSPMIGVWKYSGNEVWKHLVIWRVGYLDQSGVFGFDKSLHHRVNVQCGVKTPKWKWQTSTHLSSISNSDLNSFEFCKSVRLRSQESFGRQSSLRTTDSNQVFGIGAQDCGIYASAVCVHIKNGAPELRGSHIEACPVSWSDEGFPISSCCKVPDGRQVNIGGRWTPSIRLCELEGISSRQYFPIL